ncbi:hypothetical protein [Aureimonas populi]|uniref:Uncharacterized protein n=1 Tax=Aureimonas populi TaxID=1701758 RepID=A0ABW5CK95_9HYPH|nr:hypothetical protein [Aureimonas populi]
MENARITRQRELVETMRQRLHFELLLLDRMLRKAGHDVPEGQPAAIRDVLAKARHRQRGKAMELAGPQGLAARETAR